MRMRCSYSMTTRRSTKHTEIGLKISLEQVALRAEETPLFVHINARPRLARRDPNRTALRQSPPEVKQITDEAIATIKSIAVREPCKGIIYSAANANGDPGTSIFHVGNDVKEYIVSGLKRLDTLDQRHRP